ncbi:P-loop containing nucleoside triphosphate hydrolase protein [Fimicolochytrium jonesii]|uniref:P-loop containing nucleoside triphosphate hydrolase protein n=1 Tax=Fimicolochytrium jonesii TaxID=1396493 RepID=UPI0022FF2495|nr:P-loop containing nucleoside triphosphate hydrolase protein [Fimicolochytrium jonesii]KAI8816317.1 P-loop containing nucleoside triphosphate hydrolase protein [Fimicolochytrium jonesii]
MERILLPAFYRFITAAFPSRTEKLASLISFSDLTSPADWYEETRKTKRRFILHVGPTNSGKTYAALKRFEEVESAIYCGPLRLLAHEVYERMNAKGIPCNLLTGEERRESDGVHKTAATVEMAPVGRRFQVAVLDEIQMIGDPSRGWAWTQAVLGIQADEVHLCGEPTAVPLIMAMTEDTGDIVEVKEYERLTPLKVSAHSLNSDLTSLRRGDCIATFSRQNIFALKRQIEQKTALKAAVIYGSLPPETRTEQARQFNDPNGPYDVLVASDAIGMGLNLNIGRMIFERMEKWNGQSVEQLSVSQTKQIAGRAGRFQTQWENGECCTFDEYDMPALREAMRMPTPGVTAAGLLPTLEQLELFHRLLPEETLTALLDRFQDLASLHGRYFLCNLTSVQKIATLIEPVPLPLRERYVFTLAPCNADEPVLGVAMLAFAKAHAAGEECGLEEFVKLGTLPPGDVEELRDLEGVHRLIVLYMWLGYVDICPFFHFRFTPPLLMLMPFGMGIFSFESLRFPETFIDTDLAHHLKKECEAFINEGLAHLKFERKKKVKGAAKVARRLALAESESESSTSTTEAGTAGESAVGEGTQPRGDAEQVVAEHDMPPVKVTKPRLAASERY